MRQITFFTFTFWVATLFLIFIIYGDLEAQKSPIGVVILLRGSASVKSPSGSVPLKAALNMPIYEGYMIIAGENSQVKILLKTGKLYTVDAKKSLLISELDNKGQESASWSSIWKALVSRYKSSLTEENINALSASRGLKLELIKSPRSSKLLSLPDEVEFDALKEASDYTITIGYFEGKDKTWQRSTSSNKVSLKLKDDVPKFSRGRLYLCEVQAFRSGISIGSDTAWFELLSEIEANEVKIFTSQIAKVCGDEEFLCHLLKASYYAKKELYYDAELELKAALSLSDDNPSIHLMLAEIYRKIGLLKRADDELMKGQALEKAAMWE